MGVFLCAWPGVKADLFFSRNRHFQHLLEGRKGGTEFRITALFPSARSIRTEHYSLASKKANSRFHALAEDHLCTRVYTQRSIISNSNLKSQIVISSCRHARQEQLKCAWA
jgi:hypothetical protein